MQENLIHNILYVFPLDYLNHFLKFCPDVHHLFLRIQHLFISVALSEDMSIIFPLLVKLNK